MAALSLLCELDKQTIVLDLGAARTEKSTAIPRRVAYTQPWNFKHRSVDTGSQPSITLSQFSDEDYPLSVLAKGQVETR